MVKHRVKAGLEKPYEAWLRNIVSVAGPATGHLGVDVMRGKPAVWICSPACCAFARPTRCTAGSTRRIAANWSAEASPMLADGDLTEVNPHNEFWFVPAAENPPPRWKQACVTFLVICPLTLLIPLVWGPVFRLYPLLAHYVISTALVTVTIVLLVVYVLMPRATRLFAPWLNARPAAVAGADNEG